MSKHNYSQYSKKNDGKSGVVGANAPGANKNNKSGAVNPNYVPPATTPTVKMELKNETPVEQVVKNESPVEQVVKNETPVEQVVKNESPVVAKHAAKPETIAGTVVNCAKLNVRAKPNIKGEIVGILDVKSEVKIDADKSDNEWFKICTTTGIDGYCMRKFIEAHA